MAERAASVQSVERSEKLRVPPHSIEAEQAVLGGAMLDAQAFDEVSDSLQEADFYRHDHRLIFRAIADLSSNNKPTDGVTVSEWLEQRNLLDEAGGLVYVGALAKDSPGAANIRAYADIVRERATYRDLIRAGNNIAQAAYAPEGRDVREIIDLAQTAVFSVEREKNEGPQLLVRDYVGWRDQLDERANSEGSMLGLSTGLNALDVRTLGLEKGDVWIGAGRPSMGKTTWGMNVAETNAIQGLPVAVFSLEMPRRQLLTRSVASLARIDFGKLRSGKLDDIDRERLRDAANQLTSMPLYVDEQPALTVNEIRARCRRMKRKHGLELVVIDYLQLMEAKAENRNNEISVITRGLKRLAKDLDVPVIALAQLNREVEKRKDKRPMMSDLRDSGSIEQDADVVLLFHREAYYDRNKEFDHVAEIDIAKQRNGATERCYVEYQGHLMRFDNLHAGDVMNYHAWIREKDNMGFRKGKNEGFRE